MKCLSSIWKLRKRSDRVKIILWLYLAACVFLFLGVKGRSRMDTSREKAGYI